MCVYSSFHLRPDPNCLITHLRHAKSPTLSKVGTTEILERGASSLDQGDVTGLRVFPRRKGAVRPCVQQQMLA